ncbi:MAG TPA: adenylosuccinate synthetase [Candidatus Bathyarchaeota archaeon]|nr:adenylosuccinate synthetase [Candidatus Bathyarchaeota archaeon]HEX68762.1 adenylosuccinate synthetase [Candidatus Bathyarchaeota archaeon]
MPCTVVVGGFWGDEGKGKIISYLALKDNIEVCARAGSVNAAHTVIHEGKALKLHMIPSGFVNKNCRLLLGAGVNIHVPQLLKEIKETNAGNRLGIDAQCSIIEEKHSIQDKTSAHLKGVIGTTGWGVGPAIEERVRRTAKLARDIAELKPYLTDVAMEVNNAIDEGKNVLLEGTQGLYLSLYHGTYPYVTGRDTSASAVCSEIGIGPKKVDNVLVVFKAYVTRVGGGPLPNELPREEVIRRGWLEISGTGRERRAAPFNYELARKAVIINSATEAAVTKLDVIFPKCRKAKNYEELPVEARNFIERIEAEIKVPVTLIGIGPSSLQIIDRRNS